VSTTDFANVGAALNDDSVKDARSGDWVKITGIFNIITKSNPTATTDFISLNAITTWESITGKPSEITDAQVTSGVGTDPVLVTPAKAKAMIEAHSTSDSGVNSYIDLENRPDDVISTTIVHGKVYTTVCCARCVCCS
jgi:DNA replicative helicase MCM subunit Mcm2 (Cdc46/Mcm family)